MQLPFAPVARTAIFLSMPEISKSLVFLAYPPAAALWRRGFFLASGKAVLRPFSPLSGLGEVFFV
jgi:hypothetical protein